MKIGFIGLGLIGGSMAMALLHFDDAQMFCVDTDAQTRKQALARGVVAQAYEASGDAPIEAADVIVLCLHPEASVRWIGENGARMKPGAVLTDVCGTKRSIAKAAQALPKDVAYIGGHPMAGKEQGGFSNATASLFMGAHYILVPGEKTTRAAQELLTRMAMHMGCKDVICTDAQTHDERIAYTSQMMHVLALAICDQEQLMDSKGFEGGSFRAATRVAALDARLWTELFWENKDALALQVQALTQKLEEYVQLLQGDDREAVYARLQSSAARKEAYNHAQD